MRSTTTSSVQRPKVNLTFIAKEAGVSISTVSFYINGKAKEQKLSEQTCRKIESVVQKYHFVPNIFARAMKANKTYLLGLVLPGGLARSYWISIIEGMEAVLKKERYHLVLSVSSYDPASELDSLTQMYSKGVDGFFYAPVYNSSNQLENLDYIHELSKFKPVVWLNKPPEGESAVCTDHDSGGRQAAAYLWEQGHRRVAYLGHSQSLYDRRGRAFILEFSRLGGRVFTFDSANECAGMAQCFTAVFCYSDYFLIDLYGQCKIRNISIPDDLSVLGYDKMNFIDLLQPKPSTFETAKEQLGHRAAEMMLAKLKEPAGTRETTVEYLEPKLFVGDSVRSLK